ncbi:hypothetical protein SKUL_2 [Pseudomonas phage Skulduggery]|uniref:Uncharacterized protein n=1 Tax=Pseudomonas phage Skulduggery TaxID=2006671 RepID=A0A1Y0SUA7_9CAUD|nr:hypothetical protein PP627_gp02 [Pseudomonas phage Skulduggery]ARV77101.1 hypothetical protein SKUL_2 [Pseudomonas phage Skulduggery]
MNVQTHADVPAPVIGIELTTWRKAYGFRSQEALAKALGVGLRTITRLEASANPLPHVYTLALKQLAEQHTLTNALAAAKALVTALSAQH